MDRLTGKTSRSLMEAYAAVYDQDLRNKIEEEKKAEEDLINNFVEFIDALLEEGYDLSNCKYEDLCDAYISCLNEVCVLEEGLAGSALKAAGGFLKKEAGRILSKYGPRVASGLYQGTKGAVKQTLKGSGAVLKGVRDVAGQALTSTGKGIKDVAMQGAKLGRPAAWLGTAAAAGLGAQHLLNKAGMPSLPGTVKTQPSQRPSETPAERATRQRNELKVVSGGSGGYVSKMEPSSSKYKESQALADKLTAQQLRQQRKAPAAPSTTTPPTAPQLEVGPDGTIKLK